MAPAMALGRVLSRNRGLQLTNPKSSSLCLFSHSPQRLFSAPSSTTALRSPRHQPAFRRYQSTTSSTSSNSSSSSNSNPRADLHRALLDLQTHSPHHISYPRLQLALRNLTEPAGHESVRLAVFSFANDETSSPTKPTTATATATPTSTATPTTTATRLLRLALADPLQPAATWEAQLEAHDAARHPLVVRAGAELRAEAEGLHTNRDLHAIPELGVATPLLLSRRGAAELEVLVTGAGPVLAAAAAAAGEGGGGGGGGVVDEAVLVPAVGVADTTGRYVAPVESPVHLALLVGDGVRGAASILALPVGEERDVIAGVVNFGNVGREDLEGCPLIAVNVDAASEGLELFRADVGNAKKYETLWTEANIGAVSEWLRKSTLPSDEGVMKAPVRKLIGSLLRSARASIQREEALGLGVELHTKLPTATIAHLDEVLAKWAKNAHQELQQQLDIAFNTSPWNELGWWNLFWRADDVGMVTSELVALHFLPGAEKGLIYLAGRIKGAGVEAGQQGQPQYTGPALPQTSNGHQRQDADTPDGVSRWPAHIPFTRNYLQRKTVPALQALAQKLVVQSASLAGLSTALAGLSFFSGLGAYECGAIAALGIVFSFKRFQHEWDTAREYWEEEVREEGRKAIRATETSIAEVLEEAGKTPDPEDDPGAQLGGSAKAKEIVKRAEDAYARIK